jgi:hypothetical protein
MEDFKVIETILNLGDSWIVVKMELEPEEGAVHIYLQYNKAYGVDKSTGELCKIYDYRAVSYICNIFCKFTSKL